MSDYLTTEVAIDSQLTALIREMCYGMLYYVLYYYFIIIFKS